MKALRRILPALLILLSTAVYAQNTIPVTGTGIVAPNGTPLTGSLTFTVTDANDAQVYYSFPGVSSSLAVVVDQVVAGAMAPNSTMPNPATIVTASQAYFRLTYKDVSGNVIYNLPTNQIGAVGQYSIQTFTVPSTAHISGAGFPRLACNPGAQYTDTVKGGNIWICSRLAIDGTIQWTQNPSSSVQCQNQAIISPIYGAPYCTAETNAAASPGLVLGTPTNGTGQVSLVAAPTGGNGGSGASATYGQITLTPTPNGTNTVFLLNSTPASYYAQLNGIALTPGRDYLAGSNQITMTVAPQATDLLTATTSSIASGVGSLTLLTPSGAINGSNTVFTTSGMVNSIELFVNGVQQPTSFYTFSAGTITFTSATLPPQTGDVLAYIPLS